MRRELPSSSARRRPDEVRAALARPEVASVLVPGAKRELLDLDLTKLTYGTFSIAACDLDAGQWGVATQSKFLAVGSVVPWAEPHVGAVATQAYANPRYGPQGLELLRAGAPGRGGRTAADRRGRGTRAPPARRRRRRGTRRDLHRLGVPGLGGRPNGRRVCRAGQHPRVRRDGGRDRRDVRVERGPARGAPDRVPRGRAGGRRRQPWTAVSRAARRREGRRLRGPLRRRRRPPRRRPRAPDRGAAPAVRHPPAALRQDAAVGVDRRGRSPARGAAGTPRQARLRESRRVGGSARTWRSASTGRTRSTPSCSKSCRRQTA